MIPWTDKNKSLKSMVISFLESQGEDIQSITESCKFIANTAHHCALVMIDYSNRLEHCQDYLSDDPIEKHFGDIPDSMRSQIMDFINRKCALEYEALQIMADQRLWNKDDPPNAEVQVLPTKILIVGFVSIEKFKGLLPSGGSYQGTGTRKWEYPLHSISQLTDTEFPMIIHPGAPPLTR